MILVFTPKTIYAQVKEVENLYNDTTEFFLQPKSVVDTVKVEAIAAAFKEQCKNQLAAKKDSLVKELEILNKIVNLNEKEKLSPNDGTLATYTQLLNELKIEDDTPSFMQNFDKKPRAVYFKKSKDPRGCATPEWTAQYAKEKNKAEKLLEKKQLTHPVIMKYVIWVNGKCKSEINNVEEKIESYNDKRDAFYWYYQSEKKRDYPQKQITVKVRNGNYRPYLLFGNNGDYRGPKSVDELDMRLQQRGWEWVQDTNKRTQKNESYPYEYSYYSYAEHPDYRLVYMNTNKGGYAIFDKDGNFIRYPYLSHKKIIYDKNPDIIDNLLTLEYRKDYINNKYNIKSENQDVQYAIVNRLGLSKESNDKMAKAFIKGMEGGMLYKYSNSWQESVKGYNQRDQAAKKAAGEIFRLLNDTAENFLDQLKKDHEEDFKYIYKIERMSNASFKVYFVTKELKPKCDVVITYYQVKPFLCDWQIDDIVYY
jgi:hypothetical protein